MPFLFAHVSADGTVDGLGGGITQANLDSIDIEPGEEEGITNEWEYCFTGLPPLSGGQVTIDGGKDAIAAITLETGNPDCSPARRAVATRPLVRGPRSVANRGRSGGCGFDVGSRACCFKSNMRLLL
jgi:hypothetical protein